QAANAYATALRDNPPLLAHYRQRFGQLLVDEFQDTNAIQYGFVRLLAGDSGQVFVVGDDRQIRCVRSMPACHFWSDSLIACWTNGRQHLLPTRARWEAVVLGPIITARPAGQPRASATRTGRPAAAARGRRPVVVLREC